MPYAVEDILEGMSLDITEVIRKAQEQHRFRPEDIKVATNEFSGQEFIHWFEGNHFISLEADDPLEPLSFISLGVQSAFTMQIKYYSYTGDKTYEQLKELAMVHGLEGVDWNEYEDWEPA